MIEIKHKIAIIIPIILCLMLLSFGAYKYVEDRKNITAMKEDIDIEIILPFKKGKHNINLKKGEKARLIG